MHEQPAQREAALAAERMYAGDRASQALGIAIEDVAPGQATARMTVSATMVNGHGIAHGGYIFLLADTAFAFACNTRGPHVAAAASIEFVQPVHEGEQLIARATERLLQARSGIYDVSVRREDGSVVAEFRGRSRPMRAHEDAR